ncbi:hypothetical protein [Parasalinivibrio latis]
MMEIQKGKNDPENVSTLNMAWYILKPEGASDQATYDGFLTS